MEIRHDDKLPEGNAHLQTAVLFTSCSGQRRLRIHNLALAVSADYNQLYRVADLNCLTAFLFKQGIRSVKYCTKYSEQMCCCGKDDRK